MLTKSIIIQVQNRQTSINHYIDGREARLLQKNLWLNENEPSPAILKSEGDLIEILNPARKVNTFIYDNQLSKLLTSGPLSVTITFEVKES